MLEQIISNLNPAIGQRLNMVRAKDNSLWLVFDDDVIMIEFPSIECRCIGCVEKGEKKK